MEDSAYEKQGDDLDGSGGGAGNAGLSEGAYQQRYRGILAAGAVRGEGYA